MEKLVPAWYYQHFDADYSLPHPGQGFGGWKKSEIPLDPAHTAVLLMHAWRCDGYDATPAVYRLVEYLPRADAILRERFPGFLDTVRASGVRLIHIGSESEKSLPELPGYHRVKSATPPVPPAERIVPGENLRTLQKFHADHAYPGYNGAFLPQEQKIRDFHFRPRDDEDVACNTAELFALCRRYDIQHLIYTGFAVNACLTLSPCGFFDMSRHGLMCSIVRDLTTAVENKESCAEERFKEYGLWSFSLWGGFVFEQAELEERFLR